MAQPQVGDQGGEAPQHKHQGAVRERQVLGEKLRTGAGQANGGDHAGDEDEQGQEGAPHATEGVLHIGVQDLGTILGIGHQFTTAGAELEQAQIDQSQAHASHEARQYGVAGQQFGTVDAPGAGRVDDDDAKHHGPQGIHGQVAVDETVGEGKLLIGLGGRDGAARGPEQGGEAEHGQGKYFHRCQHVTDRVQQPPRVEGDADHQGEVDDAVDEQRGRIAAKEGGKTHFIGDGGGARCGKQRADGQVADGGQQHAGPFADGQAEGIDATANPRQRDHGQDGQPDCRQQEAQGGGPDLFTGLQTDHGGEDDVACADEERKGHKSQGDDIFGS
ncbi:hypothetical protein D3C79_622050 [compost metagenome]